MKKINASYITTNAATHTHTTRPNIVLKEKDKIHNWATINGTLREHHDSVCRSK
jgi:hypothetical protein